MKIDNQTHGAVTVLVPHGPLIAEDLVELRRSVESAVAARPGRVVVDLKEVPYLDSAGIELLLSACGNAAVAGRPRLARLTDTCREALELTDVLSRLAIFDTVENAVRNCKR